MELGVGFLDVRRIRQHDGRQLRGHLSSVHGAFEAVPAELWNKTAMIDMSVGQKYAVDIRRIEKKIFVIQAANPFRSLKHTAVDQELYFFRLQEIGRSSDRMRRSQKS